jgi:hypothetical protein
MHLFYFFLSVEFEWFTDFYNYNNADKNALAMVPCTCQNTYYLGVEMLPEYPHFKFFENAK